MRPSYLMKWNSPAGAVIAPKPYDRRRLLFLPGLRFRTVLLFKGKRGINVHGQTVHSLLHHFHDFSVARIGRVGAMRVVFLVWTPGKRWPDRVYPEDLGRGVVSREVQEGLEDR
jgi:hypothetical protein